MADTAIANARDVLTFFQEERAKAIASTSAIIDLGAYEKLSDLSAAPDAIDSLERSLTTPSWAAAYGRFPTKSNATGTVVNVKDFGVFVELEPGISGLIPAQRLPLGFKKLEQFTYGERVIVEIQSVNAIKKRIDMSFVSPAPEENPADTAQMTLEMMPASDLEPPS
jgi:small subunit ribosomal protein S1